MVRRFSKKIFQKADKGAYAINCKLMYLIVLLLSMHSYCQSGYTIVPNKTLEDYPQKKEVLKHLGLVNVYDLTYTSVDNLKIKGFIITPRDSTRKYPVVIYNRGGNGSYGMVSEPFLFRFLANLSSKGFIIIGSQLRGSEGSEGEDEFGGRDIDDVESLFKIADNLKIADTSRVAQIGWSRGGITNFQLLKRSGRIKTTVNIAGPSNILKTKRKIMFTVYRNRIPNYALDSIKFANRISPVFQLDSIKNPKGSILYIHGDNDQAVEVENSKELYAESKKRKIKSELVIFPGGDHSLREHFDKLIDIIVSWFKTEL